MTLADLDLDLATILAAVTAEHSGLVAAWLRDEPGSWGALAAQAVLATRRALGRRLSDAERRIVWQALWDRLTAIRHIQIMLDSNGPKP
ncbi:MAG TPA: hypothetical protein VIL85_18485 [Thermomicrobiales bacterium]|jgi:hypothetical protein